jgi:phospholipase C
MPPAGLDNLKHIVVLMMENRSFDHMLGALMAQDKRIDGLDGTQTNPDTTNTQFPVKPLAEFQGQLDPDPDHHFPGVDLQIFGGVPPRSGRVANMQGFIKSYFQQQQNVQQSQKIMYYFTPEKLPVLTGLATQFAVFNGWFSSIPGPTICNRAFAHYGTSFGQVGMNIFEWKGPYLSIYERVFLAGRTAKIYYYDGPSSTMEIVNLLRNQSKIFGTFDQFLGDCKSGNLPDYSFVEPNYNDHDSDSGAEIASDQHPDHHVQHGEIFINNVYNAIFNNEELWKSTALLIVYDEHGGIYDHVPPPDCTPDDAAFVASADKTGTGASFAFDRLGVRVPAILVSPWVPKNVVIPGPNQRNGRKFDHASIPATVMKFILRDFDPNTLSPANKQKFLASSKREQAADTFLDLLGDKMQPDDDIPTFVVR